MQTFGTLVMNGRVEFSRNPDTGFQANFMKTDRKWSYFWEVRWKGDGIGTKQKFSASRASGRILQTLFVRLFFHPKLEAVCESQDLLISQGIQQFVCD